MFYHTLLFTNMFVASATVIRVTYKNTKIYKYQQLFVYCLYSCMTPWWW